MKTILFSTGNNERCYLDEINRHLNKKYVKSSPTTVYLFSYDEGIVWDLNNIIINSIYETYL